MLFRSDLNQIEVVDVGLGQGRVVGGRRRRPRRSGPDEPNYAHIPIKTDGTVERFEPTFFARGSLRDPLAKNVGEKG